MTGRAIVAVIAAAAMLGSCSAETGNRRIAQAVPPPILLLPSAGQTSSPASALPDYALEPWRVSSRPSAFAKCAAFAAAIEIVSAMTLGTSAKSLKSFLFIASPTQ